MRLIKPCLWFKDNAEQAVEFYLSVFQGEEIDRLYYTSAGPGVEGSLLSITFRLYDQQFIALNGGSEASYSHALSLCVDCRDQAEIDHLWQGLLAEAGQSLQCGWVQDKFGVCWQIVPAILDEMLQDQQRAPAVMAALLSMDKLNLSRLQQAYTQD
ncbi:3-demethylubiquinone-9 3-methyltransferase [Methylophaga lonarensis MPL]|uniref:3-demethylubiquinone-9 3-methyltransferase n=1 Tax=Methylophaga lonarensis MPL TaxID=1286106 RepID=M7P2Y6_9GAMM|nr:VOC family protein [Methylophaga lonarensis]EMR13871.1 3-demethylubiquinone-9 3-methyltransferase [Methylophaga lonarensis MPL]